MHQDPIVDQKKILKIAAAVFGGVILIWFIFFAATHGIVRLEEAGVTGKYTLHTVGGDTPVNKEFTGNWKIVSTGDYTIEFEGKDVTSLQYMSVPNFFRSTTASFTDVAPREVHRIAVDTLNHLMYGTDRSEVLSLNDNNSTGLMIAHQSVDPTGLSAKVRQAPPFSFQTLVNGDQTVTLKATDDEEYEPLIFTPATGQNTVIDKTYVEEEFITTLQGPSIINSDTFALHFGEGDTAKLDIYNGPQLVRTFSLADEVALAEDGNPAIAVNNTHTAIGYGNDFLGVTDHSHEEITGDKEPIENDYIVKIFDNSNGKEVESINLGRLNDIAGISLSPNLDHLAVLHANAMTVYNTKSDKPVFTYNLSYVSNVQWIDNNRLLFDVVDRGLFILDVEKRRATSAYANTPLRASSYNVIGDQVLFTAFTDSSSTPDGYAINLTKPATDGNVLIKKLPMESNLFKLTTLNGIIYAAPNTSGFSGPNPSFRTVNTVSDELRQAVNLYLEKNIPNHKQYQLVFGENL